MSAFIVSDEHLNYLVNFAFQKDLYFRNGDFVLKTTDNPQEVFNILYRQNVESVNARYKEENIWPASQWKRRCQNWNLVQVLKACDCYDYQACETENYNQSMAKKIVHAIRKRAISGLPGYEEADWEITTHPEDKKIEVA